MPKIRAIKSNTRFYQKWWGIIKRCNYKSFHAYHRYGGRGIKCLWKNFDEYAKDMFSSYKIFVARHGEHNTTLDRIDKNGHYCKENCRWATWITQANNTSRNRFYYLNGQKKTLSQFAHQYGMNPIRVWRRVYSLKWSLKKALETPIMDWPQKTHSDKRHYKKIPCSFCGVASYRRHLLNCKSIK